MDWMYPWAGLAVGLLIGLTGIGAGSIMTSLLIVVFGLPPTVAVHLSLVYASVTKVFGAWAHVRAGNVDLPLIWRMAVGSVPGVLLGSALVAYGVVAHPERVQGILRHGVGWALLLASGTVVTRTWWQGRLAAGWIRAQAARWRLWPFVCFGVGRRSRRSASGPTSGPPRPPTGPGVTQPTRRQPILRRGRLRHHQLSPMASEAAGSSIGAGGPGLGKPGG